MAGIEGFVELGAGEITATRDANGAGPSTVAYWDTDLRVRTFNTAFAAFVGRPREEIAGRHASELLGPELFELNTPFAKRALAGKQQFFDRSVKDADGVARHVQASFIPDCQDGRVVGFYAVVTDVTAEREDSRVLAAVEAAFRRAFLASPVGKATFDDGGRMLQVNPALCAMLGHEPDALAGRPFVDLFGPAEQAEERQRLSQLFAGELDPSSTEQVLRRADGSPLWVILSLALSDGDGHHAALGIAQFQDITERRRVEDELRRSQARLSEAEQLAQMGSWELDVASGRMRWSAGLCRILGLPTDEHDIGLETAVLEHVYPDDQDVVRETLTRAIAERSVFNLDYRVVRADGRVRTLRVRSEVVVDDNGDPARVVGVAQDISEAKRAHDALQQASADMEHRARELQQLARRTDGGEDDAPPQSALTARQLEILNLVAQGLTNAAIAERLFVGETTVKWHLKQILAKTASSNRAEAVARVLGGGQ